MNAMDKQQLRRHLRSLWQGETARHQESMRLCRHVMDSPYYKSAKVIGAYMPLSREADIVPILEDILKQGKTLALPLCGDAPCMTMRQVLDLNELLPGAYGILEPSGEAPVIDPERIELMLVPLEGIDRDGFRLGKGAGYYDHLLAGCSTFTMGCALSWQWAERIPRDAWDQKLHTCADANGIMVFKTIAQSEDDPDGQEKAAN